jgi:hypothetical protein
MLMLPKWSVIAGMVRRLFGCVEMRYRMEVDGKQKMKTMAGYL